ncbi:unnamed protein product [Paramecium pentaurelia]|uniref:Uncharacterized protein n=1 Tax=Paramecium pentaurelia TaxID=43138 RepID=A0A8S1RYR4_9CILI|nr:unnamed protein product [Paramecium pentaurelia]
MAESKNSSYFKPFLFGAISGCSAAAIIMPIDTLKVRIQIQSENLGLGVVSHKKNIFQISREMLQKEGLRGFYSGLGSALLRQLTYTTTRLGIFRIITDKVKKQQQRDLTFFEKVGASSFAGFIGALVGNPTDVCLIRFQADQSLPIEERRNYKNAFEALTRIYREEGLLAFWKGSMPTVTRAVAITIGQLTTYDQLKQMSMQLKDSKNETAFDRIMASCGAGIISSIISLPFDNVKTKLQKMKSLPDGSMPYQGVIDCFMKSIKREKFIGLWVGLFVYFSRVAPQSIMILLIQDFLHHKYGKN